MQALEGVEVTAASKLPGCGSSAPASALREKQKSASEADSLDDPCVVARNESGHLSDFRETHGSELSAVQRITATTRTFGDIEESEGMAPVASERYSVWL